MVERELEKRGKDWCSELRVHGQDLLGDKAVSDMMFFSAGFVRRRS